MIEPPTSHQDATVQPARDTDLELAPEAAGRFLLASCLRDSFERTGRMLRDYEIDTPVSEPSKATAPRLVLRAFHRHRGPITLESLPTLPEVARLMFVVASVLRRFGWATTPEVAA